MPRSPNWRRQGFFCRQDFTFDEEHGHEQMEDHINDEEKSGVRVRGFTYFSVEAADEVLAGGKLRLRFGVREGSAEEAEDIGLDVAIALRRHSLKVIWDGKGGNGRFWWRWCGGSGGDTVRRAGLDATRQHKTETFKPPGQTLDKTTILDSDRIASTMTKQTHCFLEDSRRKRTKCCRLVTSSMNRFPGIRFGVFPPTE